MGRRANGGRPVVGFVGRIEPRKGVLDLIAAAPAIRAASPGAEVVIVGDDPWDAFPDYLAQVRAARDVVHVPWHDNAPGLMRHFDVLVAPSHQEPFGTVLSEAMAVGTPVVATRVGGLAEVVDDGVTGLLVEPGEPDALAGRGPRRPRAARRDERRRAPGRAALRRRRLRRARRRADPALMRGATMRP